VRAHVCVCVCADAEKKVGWFLFLGAVMETWVGSAVLGGAGVACERWERGVWGRGCKVLRCADQGDGTTQ
jgi:hypothetical protein